MNNTKILAVDLDGTLFSDDTSICEKNINALNEMLDEGHVLAIDTGRPAHVLENLLNPYPVFKRENVYFLTYQGSVGYDALNKKEIFATNLDGEASIKLLNCIHDAGLTAIGFESNRIFAFGTDENVQGYARVAKEPVDFITGTDEVKGHSFLKIMSVNFNNHQALHDFEEAHLEETNKYFNSMFSNVAFLEYVSKDASKGAGLLKLAEYLNIPAENTIACGDERNDISMVEMAGIGCAVNNAREELKAVADYITEVSNNDGAVAEVINKFILN